MSIAADRGSMMPKRLRRGPVSRLARVVAPTRVNGRRSMRTLRADGARKVALGHTTISEVVRVTQEDIL